MKAGGAELRVLHRPTPDFNGAENWCGKVIEAARSVADYSEPGSELCGYVMLGLYTDGMHSFGYRFDETRSRIPRVLLPALVAELVRRDVVTKGKFEDMFERT